MTRSDTIWEGGEREGAGPWEVEWEEEDAAGDARAEVAKPVADGAVARGPGPMPLGIDEPGAVVGAIGGTPELAACIV